MCFACWGSDRDALPVYMGAYAHLHARRWHVLRGNRADEQASRVMARAFGTATMAGWASLRYAVS